MFDWLRRKRSDAPAGAAPAAQGAPAKPTVDEALATRAMADQHLSQDRFEQAAACYQQATALGAPEDATALLNQGFALCSVGRGAAAREVLQQAVALQPANHDAHYFLGLACEQCGDPAAAAESYQRSVSLKPGFDVGLRDLCRVLAQAGRLEQAQAALQQGLAAHPDNAELHFYQGNLALQQHQYAQAVPSFERALALQPAMAPVHAALAQARAGLQQWEAAVAGFRQAMALAPQDGHVHNLLGMALVRTGRLAEAVVSFRRAVALEPQSAEAHSNLGNGLRIQGEMAEAVRECQEAVRLAPSNASAHNSLGAALAGIGSYSQAADAFENAVQLDPRNPRFLSNLGGAQQMLGNLETAKECYRRALAQDPAQLDAHSNLLFVLSISADCPPQDYLIEARRYGQAARGAAGNLQRVTASWTNDRPLRVGLVSGDLRSHPVGFFLESTLRRFDARRVELLAYSTQPLQDTLTTRIRPFFREWRDVWALTDSQVADLVRRDGIDLLVDLAGHSQHNRLPVFAHRPAPVQASWLGYFASTGVAEIDYYLADRISAPPEVQTQFTETIWHLPHTRLCFTPPAERQDLSCGPLPALRHGAVTFGSFQNASKFNPEVLQAWAQVLQAVPGSRLRLQSSGQGAGASIAAALASLGIDPARVIVRPATSRQEYLRAHQEVDLILDTFPYPGGTTTCEALWMGVPTVTLAGPTLIARQGASLLACAGLGDWVAGNTQDYVAIATLRAADRAGLAELRASLRQRVLASPLFDAERFAQDLQDAFEGMATAGPAARP